MVNSDLYDNSSHYNYFDRRKNDYLEISTFLFLCVVIALVGYGLVTLYSASYDEALKNGVRPAYYLIRQTFFCSGRFCCFYFNCICSTQIH
jgi:cell division protein FtsW (lipid II flippase)